MGKRSQPFPIQALKVGLDWIGLELLFERDFLMWHQRLLLLIFLAISYPTYVSAQIVRDDTMPSPSVVTTQGATQVITNGTLSGSTLFHSFNQFSIRENQIAQFRHAPAVRNLLVRVTGNLASSIDGRLETALTSNPNNRGEANLFLLNPNGITFGKNVSLNLGGSFVASTADSIRLNNGSEFSAKNPTAPLLTIAVPIGLQFGSNPGAIETLSASNLQLPSGKTLALLGGSLTLSGGLASVNGKIELAAIDRNSRVNLDLATSTFDYADSLFKDITLLNGARIRLAGSTGVNVNLTARNITVQSGDQITGIFSSPSTTGGNISLNAKQTLTITGTNSRITTVITGAGKGTDINVQAQNLKISQGANISTFTQGAGQGGNLIVAVKDTVSADGRASGLFVNSRGTDTQSSEGNAGDLSIQAPSLILSNGAQINSVSGKSSGNSGNIKLAISKGISLSGAAISPSESIPTIPTVISTETAGTGNAGNLTITTGKLDILDGAQIITSTLGAGNAGEMMIEASEINISGAARAPNGQFVISRTGNRLASAITSDAQRTSTGHGADLIIKTDRLTIKEGAVIQSATFSSGNAGGITITAKESIQLQGIALAPEDPFPSSIIAFSGGIPNRKVFSVPGATGKGGSITIATPTLKLTDGAIIALGSLNDTNQAKGAGDRLKITAHVISLNNAELNAQTNAGNGGTFDLTANQLLFLRNGSKIITQAGGLNQDGNAGNISVTSPLIVARKTENSDVNANASKGNGGNIFITAKSIVGLEVRPRTTEFSDITASSDRGVQGTITLNSPKIDPDRGTLSLPNVPNDPSNRIDQTCSPNSSVSSQFTVAGNGGLPATPQTDRFISLPPPLVRLPKTPSTSQGATLPEESNLIREAQGMQRLADGKIRLLADEKTEAVMLGLDQHCR